MKIPLSVFCLLLLVASCSGGKSSNGSESDSIADSLTDSMPPMPLDKEDSLMAEVTVSKAADGVFYDFVASFCQNSKYQKTRILFPLQRTVNGSTYSIKQHQWHFSKLHFNNDAYTVFFASSKDLELEKAQGIDTVTVQWYEMAKNQASNYRFAKIDGQWMLTAIEEHPIEEDVNSDFILFYSTFAADPAYQAEHLAETITYDGIDPDNDDEFDAQFVKNRKISASNWSENLIPILPAQTFSNIDFGQDLSESTSERVVSLESPGSGFTSRLYFRRSGDTWHLFKIENY